MDASLSARLPMPVNMGADGAAYVPLSPGKGMKSASIIYESIRNLPDATPIRGDYDMHAHPRIYFPDRTPKALRRHADTHASKARKIEACRREFSTFLASIAIDAIQSQGAAPKLAQAGMELQLMSNPSWKARVNSGCVTSRIRCA